MQCNSSFSSLRAYFESFRGIQFGSSNRSYITTVFQYPSVQFLFHLGCLTIISTRTRNVNKTVFYNSNRLFFKAQSTRTKPQNDEAVFI